MEKGKKEDESRLDRIHYFPDCIAARHNREVDIPDVPDVDVKVEVNVAEYYINPTNLKFDGPDMYHNEHDFMDNDPVIEEMERKKQVWIDKCYLDPSILVNLIYQLGIDSDDIRFQAVLDVFTDFEFRTKKTIPDTTDPWYSFITDDARRDINRVIIKFVRSNKVTYLTQPKLHTLKLILNTFKDSIIVNDDIMEEINSYIELLDQEKSRRAVRVMVEHNKSKKGKNRNKKLKYLQKKEMKEIKKLEEQIVDRTEVQGLIVHDITKNSVENFKNIQQHLASSSSLPVLNEDVQSILEDHQFGKKERIEHEQ